MYGFGSNLYGQLGLGPVVQESPYPQLITQLSHLNIVDIVAGQYHTVALTSHGQVYTWGWGIHGQLGHRTCDNEYYPKRLQFPKTIVQIAAGHAHTIIITANGKMYGFGSNVFGQLDCTNACKYKTAGPARIFLQSDMNVPIEKVASAYFHNVSCCFFFILFINLIQGYVRIEYWTRDFLNVLLILPLKINTKKM